MNNITHAQSSYFCMFVFLLMASASLHFLSISNHKREKISRHSSIHEAVGLSIDGNDTISNEYIIHIDEAHTKGLKHRGVWIFIYDNSTGTILFSKRSKNTVTCASAWMVNGEHSRPGETYLNTMIRGIHEELGLNYDQIYNYYSLSKGPELFKILYVDGRLDYQWTESYIVAVNRSSVRVDGKEHTSFRWIPIREIGRWLNNCDSYGCVGCVVVNATVRRGSSEIVYGKDFLNFYMIRFTQKIITMFINRTI